MATTQLKQGFITPDGKVFTTAAEARDYLREPLVKAALKKVSGGDSNLADFLFSNEDEIQKAFEAGQVARVTKAERNKLTKTMEYLKGITDGKLKFIQDNAEAIVDSFRWPSVKRLTEDEKAAATLATLTALADANAAKWVIANKDAILAAFEAGVEKRMPNPKAMEALAAARAAKTAAKVAADAAKTEAPAA